MTLTQMAFDITSDPIYRWENYYIAEANNAAVCALRQWPRWQGRVLGIVGPRFSGKTHLAHLLRQESRAMFLNVTQVLEEDLTPLLHDHPFVVVEDVDRLNDLTKLFHVYNLIHEHQGYLLLTSQKPFGDLHIPLRDLASRLHGVPQVEIQEPDDELLRALLIKRFSDRQLNVSDKVLDYLIEHIPRSYAGVQMVSDRLDRESLLQKRRLTVPFARGVLD
jgi:chromosomal replication initiation ATPase DnaA